MLYIKRFSQEGVHAEALRLFFDIALTVGRHEDYGKVGMGLADLSQKLQTAHPREFVVEKNHVRRIFRKLCYSFARVPRQYDLKVLLLDNFCEQSADPDLVVDNHHAHFRNPPEKNLSARLSTSLFHYKTS